MSSVPATTVADVPVCYVLSRKTQIHRHKCWSTMAELQCLVEITQTQTDRWMFFSHPMCFDTRSISMGWEEGPYATPPHLLYVGGFI